jgi:hypothetical protein
VGDQNASGAAGLSRSASLEPSHCAASDLHLDEGRDVDLEGISASRRVFAVSWQP